MNTNQSPETIYGLAHIVDAVKKHHLHREGYFAWEQDKQKSIALKKYFGGEKNADEYWAHLVTYACEKRSSQLYTALTDPLLDARAYGLLKKMNKVDTLLERQAENKTLLFLDEQKTYIKELFDEIYRIGPYDTAIKQFVRTMPAAFRTPGFIDFRYGKDRRSTLSTELFREKVRLTLSRLPKVTLDKAPDNILIPYVKERVNTLLENNHRVDEILLKEEYMNGILCILSFEHEQREAIFLSFRNKVVTTFNGKNNGECYLIDHINYLYIKKDAIGETYYGCAEVYGKTHTVLFELGQLVEQIGSYTLKGNCLFYNQGNLLVTDTTDQTNKETKQAFLRTQHGGRRHLYKFQDPADKKIRYIEKIETFDQDAQILYVYISAGPNSGKLMVKKLPLGWCL